MPHRGSHLHILCKSKFNKICSILTTYIRGHGVYTPTYQPDIPYIPTSCETSLVVEIFSWETSYGTTSYRTTSNGIATLRVSELPGTCMWDPSIKLLHFSQHDCVAVK